MRHHALVVDSRPAVVYSMVEALQRAGYSATGATSFEKAREQLNSRPPRLLLTALRLGVFNGLHLVIRARFDRPDTAAIVMSDVADPIVKAEAECYGAACLVGPVGHRTLARVLARVLGPTPRVVQGESAPIKRSANAKRRRPRPTPVTRTSGEAS